MRLHILRICFSVGFGLLLLLPAVVQVSGWKEKTGSFENKQKTAWHTFNWKHIDSLPPLYETYYNEHFPARNSLIFGYNFFSARFFEKSPKPELITVGKNGWLFLSNNEMNVFTGKMKFSDFDLRRTLSEIDYRSKVCHEMGAEYRVVIVPSKYSIYAEYMPNSIRKCNGPNATDQFIQYLNTHSLVKVLDLRPPLVAAKNEGQLFVKGDNHWNGLGTYFAYKALIQWLKKDYPIPPPHELQEFRVYDTLQRGGNLVDMLGMAEIWKGEVKKLVPLKPLPVHPASGVEYPCPKEFPYADEYEKRYLNTDTTLPGLMVVRESFTNDLFRNLLSSHFGKSLFIWDNWQHRLNADIVKQEKPRVVLCILIESMTDCFENYPDQPPAPIP
jgi:alginate O-acetyltransferase complex protein AlgJ